ncbi:YheV family putative metal-binding protein [Gilvimarinus algae]|uniref:YheV family putative metal-binding protein n=1 Tax=Gilvimarinus algae TaxID=3058037 RepID=A0ABT8TGC0_9GAMM|nr:YheV family putative metal-binding protein [Gilvimarinus sp. SDUM040014]MDO3381731.1 YheV family putative metal-binding protein [Gilvimarinus sp. SDUM040014]
MTTYSETPRFLAGAICPRCEALDRIRVYAAHGKDYRECVACGFKDELHFPGQARELETRVQRRDDGTSDEQVVQILPRQP